MKTYKLCKSVQGGNNKVALAGFVNETLEQVVSGSDEALHGLSVFFDTRKTIEQVSMELAMNMGMDGVPFREISLQVGDMEYRVAAEYRPGGDSSSDEMLPVRFMRRRADALQLVRNQLKDLMSKVAKDRDTHDEVKVIFNTASYYLDGEADREEDEVQALLFVHEKD